MRIILALVIAAAAANVQAQVWNPDLGNGRYRNPIIHADYSDPDVIRVGDDFWMTASSFSSVPALPILHSRDLVNWTIVNHAIRRLPAAFDLPQHGNGVWAPSIRYHAGAYYIFYGDPDRGIYMVKTRDPRGAWEAPVLVKAAKGWIDPSPFWDDDGQAYLVHAFAGSRAGIKSVLDVVRVSPDGTRALDEGTRVFDGHEHHPTIEGPKLYKHDGWYYIFAPAGGVPTGWQTVLRSRSIFGPYEDRIVMAQGRTPVNGPHQGGWVALPSGEDWFVHFQDRGPYGRIVHLEPMTWRNDWPVIGDDPDGDGTGEPVAKRRKPRVSHAGALAVPQATDAFDGARLGLQWQWEANDQPGWFSLGARRRGLRLFAQPLPSDTSNLWSIPNALMQKLPAPAFTTTTKVTLAGRAPGTRAGLLVLGMDYATLELRPAANGRADGVEVVQARAIDANKGAREIESAVVPTTVRSVYLRVTVREGGPGKPDTGPGAVCRFSYSLDGKRWTEIGEPFQAREGRWVGAKVGLFAVRPAGTRANDHDYADVELFRIGPAEP